MSFVGKRLELGSTGTAACAAVVAACLIAIPSANAQASNQALAGTLVPNTAQVAFDIDGSHTTGSSNTATVEVAEILNVTLTATATNLTIVPNALTAIPFTLTNTGNGTEAFQLSASFSDGTVEGFAIDTDGDGLYDPTRDTLLGPDGITPPVAPGKSLKLLVLIRSRTGNVTDLTITAKAVVGNGRTGLVIQNANGKGYDAVVGNTGATASLQFNAAPSAPVEAVLEKSQSVLAPDGSSNPIYEAVITYSLVARFTAAGTASDATISDAIPTGTKYVPGSITLDGTALSDAADSDAGTFDGTAVHVALGNVPSPSVHTVQFKVSIK